MIELDRVSFSWRQPSRQQAVFRNFSLSVERGQFVSIIGPSGCGKSTLLNLIAGLLQPDQGKLIVDGKAVHGPGLDRAIVFQTPNLFPWLSVAGNAAFGLKMQGMPEAERREKVSRMLEIVGLSDSAEKFPHELSGGMKQRAAFARVLVCEPTVLLLDEPFSSLDHHTRLGMQGFLSDLSATLKPTILMVTHVIDEAIALSDRVVALGRCGEGLAGEVPVSLQSPRDPASTEFNEIRRQLIKMIEGSI
jgi:NitT/TauT family transport system ATP-binding protein